MKNWKDVPEYEGQYKVNEDGVFINAASGNELKNFIGSAGYPVISVYNRRVSKRRQLLVHRILGLVFIPNPENKKEINHINGIKTDYRLVNLEWNTTQENHLHAYKIGLQKPSEKQKSIVSQNSIRIHSKPVLQFDLNGNFIKRFSSARQAAKELQCCDDNITACCRKVVQTSKKFKWQYENQN